MPGFLETRDLVKQALTDMGERCSTRRAHRLAEVLFAIWRGEATPMQYADPTGETAVRRILATLEVRA
ncbi:hypothetical protein [Brachybacterium sp. SGAir0954]|uniref:hypothetical protein n=1 Tax=Brachybacterium sp. SGAir0954 TaxID=2571029 RepID=UPI00143CD6CF|nr:hypothetical protein [Brachybacterium sp. SGAir0954]